MKTARERANELMELMEVCSCDDCQRDYPPLIEREFRDCISAALEEAAKLAESMCHCAPHWKPYGRVDPNCEAHDIASEIRALARKDGGSNG